MDIALRYITEEHYSPFVKTIERSFGEHADEELIDIFSRMFKHSRALAAFEGEEIVGGSFVFARQMNIPGDRETLTAVVSGAGVQPTHRRRGILTAMMDKHLRESRDREEALVILGASESVIYGRYGFGIATHQERWTIDRRHTAFAHAPRVSGRVRFIEKDDAPDSLPEVTARACAGRPGFVAMSGVEWAVLIADMERDWRGAGSLFFAVYEDKGKTDGFVIYRIRAETVIVISLVAATRAAHAALWQFCFGIDLRTTIEAYKVPLDDPLPWMLVEPRSLRRSTHDAMWLRIVDAPKALEARDYAVDGRIVFDLRDEFCPWNAGRYELDAAPDGASCKPTSASPDITLTAADLGVVYLGDSSFSMLERASRIETASDDAAQLADGMFRTRLKPWWPHEI